MYLQSIISTACACLAPANAWLIGHALPGLNRSLRRHLYRISSPASGRHLFSVALVPIRVSIINKHDLNRHSHRRAMRR